MKNNAVVIAFWYLVGMTVESLVAYQRVSEKINRNWERFRTNRRDRLTQQFRFGTAPEKVAENIIEELFTHVLDWSVGDVNHQVEFADIVVTRLGIKKLIVETKRPGTLKWDHVSVQRALDQACRYADEQKVTSVAISDGELFYACDLTPSGLSDRLFVKLDSPNPPLELWWISVDGIYRKRENYKARDLEENSNESELNSNVVQLGENQNLHHKYKLPYWCFAYVGNRNDSKTWCLPYLLSDGTPDVARLPKAIQSILTNYRGARVGSLPEAAIPEVLVTLARSAYMLGKLPTKGSSSSQVYVQLELALEQLGRLGDIVR